MRNISKVLLLLVGLALLPVAVYCAEPVEGRHALRAFMRPKLVHSQKILRALLDSDFLTVEESSKSLILLSQAAQWQVEQTPAYQRASEDFRSKVEVLLKAAEQKDIQKATAAYNNVTASCISCHNRNRGN